MTNDSINILPFVQAKYSSKYFLLISVEYKPS